MFINCIYKWQYDEHILAPGGYHQALFVFISQQVVTWRCHALADWRAQGYPPLPEWCQDAVFCLCLGCVLFWLNVFPLCPAVTFFCLSCSCLLPKGASYRL